MTLLSADKKPRYICGLLFSHQISFLDYDLTRRNKAMCGTDENQKQLKPETTCPYTFCHQKFTKSNFFFLPDTLKGLVFFFFSCN